MNKILINILLFSALIIGSIGLITFDVWADDLSSENETTTGEKEDKVSDVNVSIPRPSYVPENYVSRTFTLQGSKNNTQTSNGIESYTYYYDYTVWYPSDLDAVCYLYGHYYDGYYIEPQVLLYDPTKLDSFGMVSVDLLSYAGSIKTTSVTVKGESYNVYLVANEAFCNHRVTSLKKDDIEKNVDTIEEISFQSFRHYFKYGTKFQDLDKMQISINDYYIFVDNSYKQAYLMGGRFMENYFYKSDKQGNFSQDIIESIKILNSYRQDKEQVYPEPKLNTCSLSGNLLVMKYYYDKDIMIPNKLYTYKDIFVKVKGVQNWINVTNALEDDEYILTLKINSSSSYVSGLLNIDTLRDLIAKQQTKETDDVVIQAIIWGVQYGYKKAGAVFSPYAFVRTNFEFSRYVFQASEGEDYDFSVGDLGDLGNLGTGGSTTIIGGTPNSPNGSSGSNNTWTDSSSSGGLSSITDWVKNFKFDFSAITGAIQGSFSLVTSFASLIGNIFQNFFGEAVGVVALLAIGICVVLRLVGR